MFSTVESRAVNGRGSGWFTRVVHAVKTVVVSTDLSGKEPNGQLGVDRVVT